MARLTALHPRLIDLSLDRMHRLLTALGEPQRRLPPVVHVAGTNGKGSTVAVLRAVAEAAGLRVHVYTSPHLVRFNERYRLAGRLIGDAELAALLERVEAANAGEPITVFEVTTAAGLLAFAETPADLLLLEVGLGGRLDATNVIDPALSVIAPVDIDHREFLGDTLELIAAEKAGIVKPGRPVVSARQAFEAEAVIEAACDRARAPLTLLGRDADCWGERGRLLVQDGDRLLDLPPPALAGAHQIDNAGLAVLAALRLAEALGEPRLADEAALAAGVAGARWPARFQRLTAGPLAAQARAAGADLWLDGGHNPHAGRALSEAAGALMKRDGRPLALVLGMLANKDAAGFLAPFAPLGPVVRTVAFEGACADPAALAALARGAGLMAAPADGVEAALTDLLRLPGPPHLLICGSLHLAGEVLGRSPETWPT